MIATRRLKNVVIFIQTIIESQFSYCPLIWRLHSGRLNNKVNYIREGALRTLYSDHKSSFNELLDKGVSFTILQKLPRVQQLKFLNTDMAYLQQY